MRIEKVPISKIKVEERIREDFGDMEALKTSIRKYGLLSPVLVDADYMLIAGARRLRAAREIGLTVIDAAVVREKSRLVKFDLELQENLVRKDFTQAEIDKSIEMKKRLMHRPWYRKLWETVKGAFDSFVSLFRRRA